MSMGTSPRANGGLAMTPQKVSVSFSRRRTHSKYPLFVAPSSDGIMGHRQDRPSVRQKLQIALLLFSRRATQLARKVRLPLAMLMAAWTLHFGGLSPTMPAHAAAAAKTTAPISRPARKTKPSKKKSAETEKSTTTITSMDRHKRNAIVAAGFGASLYSVKTRRKRGQNTDSDEDDAQKEKEEPALEIVQKLTLEDLEDEETTVEVTITDKETEDTAVISTSAKSPSTSVEVVSKNEVDDDNPIVQLLDAVGANPEVVFGFLGSSASFMVSENLFVSGLAFAWIFSLFKESETPDVADADIDDIDDIDDEEEVTAKIEEEKGLPVVIEEKNKDDETVGIEEYRPEESSSDAEESSHKVPAEEINEEIIAQKIEEEIEVVVAEATTEPVNKDGSTSFPDDKSEEVAAATPIQEIIEEAVAEETTEPIFQEKIEEVVVEELTEPIVHSADAAVEKVTEDDSQVSSSASSQKMSIGDMAYKVVMDLGLIEWDRKKREKN